MFGRETKKERLKRMEYEYQLKLNDQATKNSMIEKSLDVILPPILSLLEKALLKEEKEA